MPKRTEDISVHFAKQTIEAEAELERKGYKLPGRPVRDRPPVPARPTELHDDTLMEMWATLTAWQDHVAGVLGLCEIDERACDSIYDMAFAEILSGLAPSKRSEGSVTVAKAEASQHPQVTDAKNKLDLAYARRKVMQMMAENLERDVFLLSRELTRRQGRYESADRYRRQRP
jgi:hypothetical protein